MNGYTQIRATIGPFKGKASRHGWRSEAKRNTYAELQLIKGCHKGANHAVASLGKEAVKISGVVTAGGEGENIIALQRLGQSRQDAVSR